ncbi:MAG: cellulase family glycosylhydrolase [Bacteroidia bacterium]
MKFKIGFLSFVLCAFLFQAKGQLTPKDAVKAMMRGINIGNTMDPPTEGSWGNPPITNHAFKDYKNAGFNAIRIPITWDLHIAKTSPYKIDATWLNHVEQIVNDGLSNQLIIIINAHHDGWIKDAYTEVTKARFDSLWSQIAVRFKDKSDHLLFEIINEPNGITLANINDLNKRTLQTIRKTNPTRIVVFSGKGWSSAADLVEATVPDPADKYLMGYYHSYDPYPFGLVGPGTYGSDTDIKNTQAIFDKVTSWSVLKGIPVLLGEYGYMKNCDYNSRMCAYATVVDQALSHGIAPFAWDDGGDFPIYNRSTGGFNEIKDILIHTYKESPYKLKVSALSDTIVKVQWTNRTVKNDSIIVERKVGSGGNFAFLKKIPPLANQFVDSTTYRGKAFYYRLRANLKDSIEIQSYPVMFRVLPKYRAPYLGKSLAIPGTVQAENYDIGGEGLTFHDVDEVNQGNTYRLKDGVDISQYSSGKYSVGNVAVGEWLEYTINVPSAANYTITANVAATTAGGQFTLKFKNGTTKVFAAIATGNTSTFKPLTTNFNLLAGEQIMRLNISQTPEFSIDYINFSFVTAAPGVNLNELTLFPNPANKLVTVTGITGETVIELFTLNGILIQTFRTQENNLPISLESLSNGMYLLKCKSNSGTVSLKVIKNSNAK